MAIITKRVIYSGVGRNILGYVVQDDSGTEHMLEYNAIINNMANGTLNITNAKVYTGRYRVQTLKGVGCSLTKLPYIAIDPYDNQHNGF